MEVIALHLLGGTYVGTPGAKAPADWFAACILFRICLPVSCKDTILNMWGGHHFLLSKEI